MGDAPQDPPQPPPTRPLDALRGLFRPPRFAHALRESFARTPDGHRPYRGRHLRADLLAGLTVGVVALPLSMALAIAVGVPPQYGLYTAIVAGAVIALTGGSRFQVSGPTAAFVVVLAPVTATHGVGGLLVATALAGVLLLGLGVLRLGRLIQFVPYPVTAGFTAGIGLVIALLQLPDLLGVALPHGLHETLDKVAALAERLPEASAATALLGLGTLAGLLLVPRLTRAVPAALIVLPLAAVATWALREAGVDGIETIADRFDYLVTGADGVTLRVPGVPQIPPVPLLPWELPGPDGAPVGLSIDLIRSLLPAAVAIALLGAIESLLSAVVADASTGTEHDPDAELIGQGLGNLIAPFFGGFAATGALARTATNVRAGAQSPLAAVVHAVFVLVAIVALAPLLGALPMTALAAMLLVVAWNMAEVRHVFHALRTSPRSDALVLVTCLALTVAFDMIVAVAVGFALASLLFMRRMIEVSGVNLFAPHATSGGASGGVLVYAIAGPLFFGAAQKAMSALQAIGSDVHTVVFDLSRVPAIDATGLVNLRSALDRLSRRGVRVILGGVAPQPATALARAGLVDAPGHLAVRADLDEALALAAAQSAPPSL